MFIIIEGNPVDGFIFTGPYATVEEAEEATGEVRHANWHIAPLDAPLPSTVDHRGMWGEVSETIDAVDDKPMSVLDLIVKAEQGDLENATEYGAYIWTLVSSGLVNSTGSNQRAVAAYADTYGNDWQRLAREGFMSIFNGATTVAEAGL